jgi:hypothetical protein
MALAGLHCEPRGLSDEGKAERLERDQTEIAVLRIGATVAQAALAAPDLDEAASQAEALAIAKQTIIAAQRVSGRSLMMGF